MFYINIMKAATLAEAYLVQEGNREGLGCRALENQERGRNIHLTDPIPDLFIHIIFRTVLSLKNRSDLFCLKCLFF